MTSVGVLALAAALVPGGTQTVQQTRSAAPDGRVTLEAPAGALRVVGWDRPEVAVTGSLCSGSDLEMGGSDRLVRIEVRVDGNPFRCRVDLEVKVPAKSRVEVETMSASLAATGLAGALRSESVNGSVSVDGRLRSLEAETVLGSIEMAGSAADVRAESVNGSVTLRGASGQVEASTVTGALIVTGARFERARLETVSGSVRFEGALAPGAVLDAESVSGSVELVLPADTSAAFDLTSFSGEIVNGLSADRPTRRADDDEDEDDDGWHGHVPTSRALSFTTGSGAARVSVETLSGTIRLNKR